MSTIGERITALRLDLGMTQTELAAAIGETKQTIYKYEHGIVTNIPLSKIEALARALRCPPVALTGWDAQRAADEAEREEINRLLDHVRPDDRKTVLALLKSLAQEE